eukprot:5545113-Prymnesium_polylepis.1
MPAPLSAPEMLVHHEGACTSSTWPATELASSIPSLEMATITRAIATPATSYQLCGTETAHAPTPPAPAAGALQAAETVAPGCEPEDTSNERVVVVLELSTSTLPLTSRH